VRITARYRSVSADVGVTLAQLRYFLAAAKHGSFSAAADALHMAQPSLSAQIRRLEGEFGVPLFVRAGRRIELTDAGRRFRVHAERTLEEADTAAAAVRDAGTLRGGRVSFGAFGPAQHYPFLTDLIVDFGSRYPEVSLQIVGQNSTEVADAVREGRLEAGLVVLPVDDRGLSVHPSMREEFHYVSRDPDRLTRAVTIQDLAAAPLIVYGARLGEHDPSRYELVERAQAVGAVIAPKIEVEHLPTALDLASRGVGDTIAPGSIVRFRGYDDLGFVSLDPPLHIMLGLITRARPRLSPGVRIVMDLAQEHVQRMGETAPPSAPQVE
jgi:LysR family transcriptional regulator, cyn operon transcriptional activator